MLKKFVCRAVAGVSTFCLVYSVSAAAFAQVSAPQVKTSVPGQPMNALMFLEARTIEVESPFNELDDVAQSMNAGFAIAQSPQTQPEGFTLDSLPLIGDLLNAEGNIDLGMELPVSLNVGSVLGETGLILSTDFTMD